LLEVVNKRTEMLFAVGRLVGCKLWGKNATPWGKTIQGPTIDGSVEELVGFQATTAIDRYRYGFSLPPNVESDVEFGKMTAALVPVLMAVLRATSKAPNSWPRACFRPPLPVRPLIAGTPTTARSAMMPMTAMSSTRVKADCARKAPTESG